MKPISVVIAARDAESTIRNQLRALTTQQWPAGGEIIVADNGSTDNTRAIVLEVALRRGSDADVSIRLVDCASQTGAAFARNEGVRASRYPKIGFCDADDIVAPGWVRALTLELEKYPVVGGRLELDRLNAPELVHSRGAGLGADALPRFDDQFPVVSSCNLGIQRNTFSSVGGFDEQYVRGQDAELSLRLHEAGIHPHFTPSAVVHYRLRDTMPGLFRQAHGWGEVNDDLRERIGRRPSIPSSMRSWLWLGVHLHHLVDPNRRARWVYVAGLRTGLARNALRRYVSRLR